jgi:hypothetical protein
MQEVAMNRSLYVSVLVLMCLIFCMNHRLNAQFMRTYIKLPAGIELISAGSPNVILPGSEQNLVLPNSAKNRRAWVELRAMENLQLAIEFRVLSALIPSGDQLLIVNNGSGDFVNALSLNSTGMVLDTSGKRPEKGNGLRPYSTWLGIPYVQRSITIIHYP